jgi:UDP-N-acetylmuramyl pentapeptide phosphotransferase/UDP-N-acetylglucosamine-1-phosphate transferase
VIVNGAIVLGAVLAALILPTSGKAPIVSIMIALAYLLALVVVLRPAKFNAGSPTTS